MKQVTNLMIELSRPNVPVVVYAKQSDENTRVVKAALYDNSYTYAPPDLTAGIVNVQKPDGRVCYYDVDDITGNIVTFTLIHQALAVAGTARAEISLLDSSGSRLTSFSFDVIIEARAVPDETVASEDYVKALLDASGSYLKHATLLRVKGYYATLAALRAAVTKPTGGDMYAVGSSAPYDIYVYDPVSKQWINNGTIGQSGTIYLGETTGTATTLEITGYSGSIPHGYTFTIMPHVNATTGATLKIGSGNPLPILSHEGTPVANNMLFQNVPITLIYRQVPTPAYIVTFDTGTRTVEREAYVDGHTLKWREAGEDLRGYYVDSVTLKSGSTAAGQTATYSMKLNDPDETEIGTFDVYNGENGFDGLTAGRAVITGPSGGGTVSETTATELSYVHGVTSNIQAQIDACYAPTANAGTHNGIYRGKSLGTSITTAQYNTIDAHEYNDLFVGDYWTIPIVWNGATKNVKIRVADFGYFGDSRCVCVIDDLYSVTGDVQMNTSDSTEGGYWSASIRNGVLASLKESLADAITIQTHKEFFPSFGAPMAGEDCYVEVVSLMMAFGLYPFVLSNYVSAYEHNNHFRQLSLYRFVSLGSMLRQTGGHYPVWLRDVDGYTAAGKYFTAMYSGLATSKPTSAYVPLVYFCI